MPEESIFHSMERAIHRINEIRNRFGLNTKPLSYRGVIEEQPEGSITVRSEEPALDGDTESTQQKSSFENIIQKASEKYRIPQTLIKALIKQESNFDDTAVSKKGAMGLMQLMPTTASLLGVNDPFDAEENVLAGTQYLRELINRFDGNLNRALAAYNAGPERAKEGIPNIPETKRFIELVLEHYNNFSKYEAEEDR